MTHILKLSSGVSAGEVRGVDFWKTLCHHVFQSRHVKSIHHEMKTTTVFAEQKASLSFLVINDHRAGSESDWSEDKLSFIPVFWIHLYIFRCSAEMGFVLKAERPFSLS